MGDVQAVLEYNNVGKLSKNRTEKSTINQHNSSYPGSVGCYDTRPGNDGHILQLLQVHAPLISSPYLSHGDQIWNEKRAHYVRFEVHVF